MTATLNSTASAGVVGKRPAEAVHAPAADADTVFETDVPARLDRLPWSRFTGW
jgi:hypothetical protein